jgi:hypothetical protein
LALASLQTSQQTNQNRTLAKQSPRAWKKDAIMLYFSGVVAIDRELHNYPDHKQMENFINN